MGKDEKISSGYVSFSTGSGKTHFIAHAIAARSVILQPVTGELIATGEGVNVELIRSCAACGKRFAVRGDGNYCHDCRQLAASPLEGEWFHLVSFFIPKMISEPWLGDIREHRVIMSKEGYSRATIEWATVVEFSVLLLSWLIQILVDLLTPFKNRT
jgi:hypothetical protein